MHNYTPCMSDRPIRSLHFMHTDSLGNTYIFGDLLKVILRLSFGIALWDHYYVHLAWEEIENDLNRIVDFLINLWDSFQISFLNFINVLAMVFDNLPWRQLIQFMIWN